VTASGSEVETKERIMTGWVLRVVLAAGLLGSSALHFYVWSLGYAGVAGPLFLLNAAGGLLIGVAVLAWHNPLPAWFAVDFGVATLAAYLLAATIGIFAQQDKFATPEEYFGVFTDAVCIVFGIALLIRYRRPAAAPAVDPGRAWPLASSRIPPT
jgi:hypothetical protein